MGLLPVGAVWEETEAWVYVEQPCPQAPKRIHSEMMCRVHCIQIENCQQLQREHWTFEQSLSRIDLHQNCQSTGHLDRCLLLWSQGRPNATLNKRLHMLVGMKAKGKTKFPLNRWKEEKGLTICNAAIMESNDKNQQSQPEKQSKASTDKLAVLESAQHSQRHSP